MSGEAPTPEQTALWSVYKLGRSRIANFIDAASVTELSGLDATELLEQHAAAGRLSKESVPGLMTTYRLTDDGLVWLDEEGYEFLCQVHEARSWDAVEQAQRCLEVNSERRDAFRICEKHVSGTWEFKQRAGKLYARRA